MHKFILIRANRKTAQIRITKDGLLEVRVPYFVTKEWIDKFVYSKDKWITENLSVIKERQEQRRNFSLGYGSKVLWHGKEYPLIGEDNMTKIWIDELGFHLPSGDDADRLKYNVVRLYKMYAKPYLTERVMHFSKLMDVTMPSVKITSAKTRWGSCSKKETSSSGLSTPNMINNVRNIGYEPIYSINFSWRLMMAEDDVIDAVVVHELAHIKEMNHSERFYAVVRSILPNYDERNARLNILSNRLKQENWED